MENANTTSAPMGLDALIADTVLVFGTLVGDQELTPTNIDVLAVLYAEWLAVAAAVGIDVNTCGEAA